MSSRVGFYLRAAALAGEQADAAQNPVVKHGWRRLERSWQVLASAEQSRERLNRYLGSYAMAAAQPDPPPARSSARSGGREPNASESPLIAIVDDDEIVRSGMQDLIESLGYRAAVFASAVEYLGSGLLSEIACLITDLQMPHMSGLELQARLIESGRRTPVIFLTGHASEAVRTRAIQSGAFGFFSKPCDEASLITSLEKALAAYSPSID